MASFGALIAVRRSSFTIDAVIDVIAVAMEEIGAMWCWRLEPCGDGVFVAMEAMWRLEACGNGVFVAMEAMWRLEPLLEVVATGAMAQLPTGKEDP